MSLSHLNPFPLICFHLNKTEDDEKPEIIWKNKRSESTRERPGCSGPWFLSIRHSTGPSINQLFRKYQLIRSILMKNEE